MMKVEKLTGKFSKLNILVIGDLILDIYLKGDSSRISPEAPVPVVDIHEEQICMGGAANVAVNVRALGARVFFCSVTGKDEKSEKAVKLLNEKGVDTHYLIRAPQRETIVKERITAHSQTLVRFDKGTETELDKETEFQLMEKLEHAFFQCDALILADYNKGVFTSAIIKMIGRLRAQKPVFLAIDSGRLTRFKTIKPDLVKPNYKEACRLLALQALKDKNRVKQILSYGNNICKITGSAMAAITLDSEGAVIFKNENAIYRTKAKQIAHPNVVGAGDTFISVFTMALAAGAEIRDASKLASAAADAAVQKEGTTCCTGSELRFLFTHQSKHINSLHDLHEICKIYHEQHKKIVFTNGCFDILHRGHVNYLNRAGRLGDIMIVGINNDESISRLKGPARPINPLKDRIEVMAALSVVDHIITFGRAGNDTPVDVIKAIKPDIFVKGGDYSKRDLPEAGVVEKMGGQIRFLSHIPDHSTTNVIRRIRGIDAVIGNQ